MTKKKWAMLSAQIKAMVEAKLNRLVPTLTPTEVKRLQEQYRLTWVKRHQRKVPIRKGKKK